MKALGREGKFIAGCLIVATLLIVATALLTPSATVRDSTPSTFNTGKDGVKAAFLALPQLGYPTARWERPAEELERLDAAQTVLIVAAPQRNMVPNEAAGVRDFVRRGGWVLATDLSAAMMLTPDGAKIAIDKNECDTTSEGLSSIARIPHLRVQQTFAWKDAPIGLEFTRRCGDRAAVLMIPLGKGMIVLWSSTEPMSNSGIGSRENLQLLLASLPASHRTVLFDEYVHNYSDYLWSQTTGTPLGALGWQLALLAVLTVFSFTRRHRPLRALETIPRTSPLEFAHSMGSVYQRGGAGEAAIDEAQRRLITLLEKRCGFDKQTLRADPSAICAALEERLGYSNPQLASLLEPAEERIKPAQALTRVQALDAVSEEIDRILHKLHSTTEKHRV